MLARASILCFALLCACAAARTAPASLPSPAAFDTTKSDSKAIAIVDELVKTVGGDTAWATVKQIRWHHVVTVDGKNIVDADHAWDRWNGRHQFIKIQGDSKAKAMYELYGNVAAGFILRPNGHEEIATSQDKTKMIQEARVRWAEDSYALCMPFKLKDPGVHLSFVEERPAEGSTEPAYDVVKVTFDPGVGPTAGDVYYVVVDKATHLIDSTEIVAEGKPDTQRIGYKWSDWVTVAGLKFSTSRQNIGYQGEKIHVEDIQVDASPDDDLFIPVVQE